MVKKRLILLLSVMACLNLGAQERGRRNLDSFSELVVGDRILVRLVRSEKESAEIQTQGIDASAVKTEISGNTLTISIYGEPFTRKKVMITLHYVSLTSISVTGGADVTTTSLFKSDKLNIDLKSGGMLTLDADIGYLTGKLAEGAILTAEGYATVQDIVVYSTATLSAYDLESEVVKVKAVTGGKAKINVEKELDAESSSKGFISYKGNPPKINRIANSGGIIEAYKP
jgi:hypothetical protein